MNEQMLLLKQALLEFQKQNFDLIQKVSEMIHSRSTANGLTTFIIGGILGAIVFIFGILNSKIKNDILEGTCILFGILSFVAGVIGLALWCGPSTDFWNIVKELS